MLDRDRADVAAHVARHARVALGVQISGANRVADGESGCDVDIDLCRCVAFDRRNQLIG